MKTFCFLTLFALANARVLTAQTNTNAKIPFITNNQPKATPRAPTRISSESWYFDNTARQMIYRGHVRVNDPQMKLTCVYLVADLAKSGGHINHIVAETNVVIDFTDDKGETNHATSEKAIYDYSVQGMVTNETMTLTGHPQVDNAQYTMTGEPIVWNRANNVFTATNEEIVFHQNLGNTITKINPPAATTNTTTNKLSAPK